MTNKARDRLQRDEAATPSRDIVALGEGNDRSVEYVPFMQKDPIKLSASMVIRFLCTPTRSGRVCDERQAIRFIMLCKARGLNPWDGDAYLVGYDSQDGPQFSLITSHQAFLKRAEVHPEYDGMESGVIVRREAVGPDGQVFLETKYLIGDYFENGDQVVGGWATVYFKNRSHPMTKRLKLETFSTGKGRWQKDPAGMIVKCAEADALRSAFPNSLGGMYLEGEFSHLHASINPEAEAAQGSQEPIGPPVGRISFKKKQQNESPPNPNQENHPETNSASVPEESVSFKSARKDQVSEINGHFDRLGWTQSDTQEYLGYFGVSVTEQLSEEQAEQVLMDVSKKTS